LLLVGPFTEWNIEAGLVPVDISQPFKMLTLESYQIFFPFARMLYQIGYTKKFRVMSNNAFYLYSVGKALPTLPI